MLNARQSLVTLQGAGISRAGKWLVRGVDLAIMPGEIVTLVGPNGSGKTTTAKMALGLLKPDEGKCEMQPELRVAYVPQKISIDWTLPLTLARFMRLTGNPGDEEIASALAATKVAHLLDAEVRNLSGGEFQRAMLARAIARNPQFLVLDEPVQGVDFAGEIALYDLIKRIRDQLGCAILLISHDLHVVMAATDRVICLNGHICCSGTPTAVAASAQYKELFGARAAASIALYEHSHDHTHLPDGTVRHADGTITDHCHQEDGHHHEGALGNGKSIRKSKETPDAG